MLNNSQAQKMIEEAFPRFLVKAWTEYRDYYLFRVEYSSEEEKDWDPFFSVDKLTGEVRDFSVITDGDISELSELTWNDV